MSDDNHNDPFDDLLDGRDDLDALISSDISDDDRSQVRTNGATTDILDTELFHGDGGDSRFQSDWEHDLELREESSYGPDGEVLEELDQKFKYDVLKRSEEESEFPRSSINPSSWDRGSLGDQVTLTPGRPTTADGAIQPMAYWPGDDRDVCPVTITVAPVILDPTVAVGGVVRAVARINWGTKNGRFQMDVDIGIGFQLTLEASSVYVSGFLEANSTVNWNVHASIGFYTTARPVPVTRTAYVSNSATGAPGVVNVTRPSFASSMTFMRQLATDTYTISFLDANLTTIGQRDVAASAYVETPIPLPNDCFIVQVVFNAGGAAPRLSRVVFELI